MKVQDDNPITRLPPAPLMLGVVAACIISIGLVWLVGQQSVVALAYGGALIAILLMLLLAARLKTDPAETQMLQPDWSVTSAAIETRHRAIAIVDRANRLVCANSTYEGWFDGISSPYELAMDPASREAASEAARSAWRDGRAEVPVVRLSSGDMEYRLRIERSGRGEAYLVWRFDEIRTQRSYDGLSERLAGPLGEVLSRAGVEVALVAPDGIVQTTTPGLAERATGSRENAVGGLEFVQLLRSDDRDRIFFAREGQQGSPQTLIHVPLDIPNASKMSDADETPSIMLLLDSTVGIGGGWESTGKAAIPQLEALLSALPLGLALTDRDGRFLFANKAFLRAVERETSGLPQFPSDLVVREDKAAMADTVRRFAKGATASGDMAVRLGNNKDEPVSIGLAGVRGLGDAAVLLSISDSSEEKRLRRQVAQATKMQAVGQLAGGVAHDFNNVLTAIIGYCDLMLLRHTPGDSDYDDIQQIKANSNRAASLTRQLLAFSRQQTLRPEVLQLPDVISEVSQLLKRLLGEKIELRVRHDRDLGPVRADPGQLEQVIVNLAVNARDAIAAQGDGTGTLVMSTRKVSLKETRSLGPDMPPGDYTALIVRDTGGGVPAAVMGKIFDPFFTTKELGKGTGLGLSTVYGIIRQSGGYIYAENVGPRDGLGSGAAFTVYLPVHHGAPTAEERRADPDEPARRWSGGGRVLLVEDEDMVRAVAERALVRAGFTVTAQPDGEDGLAEIANGGVFDLVVSDVVMPGMDGPAMARAIRKLKPDLPILFMSGYAEETLRNEISIDNMYFIAKPFSVEQISRKVGEVLSAASN